MSCQYCGNDYPVASFRCEGCGAPLKARPVDFTKPGLSSLHLNPFSDRFCCMENPTDGYFRIWARRAFKLSACLYVLVIFPDAAAIIAVFALLFAMVVYAISGVIALSEGFAQDREDASSPCSDRRRTLLLVDEYEPALVAVAASR